MVDLEQASLYQFLPLRQSPDPTPFDVKPIITVIGENEFLILSWTGAGAMGVFVTGEGDPVRGTLEWAGYPKAVCEFARSTPWIRVADSVVLGLDYPYITSLLPNETIEVHNVETQMITQVVNAPTESNAARLGLVASLHGYLVPSTQRSGKMKKVKIDLVRKDKDNSTVSNP